MKAVIWILSGTLCLSSFMLEFWNKGSCENSDKYENAYRNISESTKCIFHSKDWRWIWSALLKENASEEITTSTYFYSSTGTTKKGAVLKFPGEGGLVLWEEGEGGVADNRDDRLNLLQKLQERYCFAAREWSSFKKPWQKWVGAKVNGGTSPKVFLVPRLPPPPSTSLNL